MVFHCRWRHDGSFDAWKKRSHLASRRILFAFGHGVILLFRHWIASGIPWFRKDLKPNTAVIVVELHLVFLEHTLVPVDSLCTVIFPVCVDYFIMKTPTCLCSLLLLFVLAGVSPAWQVELTRETPNGTQIPLWKNGAPGFEDRKEEPEEAKDWWVKNIHNPSLTVFLAPKEKRTGAAVVICPGGGHRLLVANAEGNEAAEYFNELGVDAFVLKYRLGREENSPYKIDVHAKQDGQRAMRWVRSVSDKLSIDPDRIGIVGFSAGGEVVSMVCYNDHAGDASAKDAIDRINCKPNFQVMIYAGPLGIPDTLPESSPPAFILVANDDGLAKVSLELALKLRTAKVPVELHMYQQGGHGFNMGNRTKLKSVSSWRHRMGDWLADSGWLKAKD